LLRPRIMVDIDSSASTPSTEMMYATAASCLAGILQRTGCRRPWNVSNQFLNLFETSISYLRCPWLPYPCMGRFLGTSRRCASNASSASSIQALLAVVPTVAPEVCADRDNLIRLFVCFGRSRIVLAPNNRQRYLVTTWQSSYAARNPTHWQHNSRG